MYRIFAKLGDGQFLFVASRNEFERAAELVKEFNAYWPNEYVIRDPKGNDVASVHHLSDPRNSKINAARDQHRRN